MLKNQKYYRLILTKDQKDVLINALSLMKHVLPEDADYRDEAVRLYWKIAKLQAVKEGRCF